MVTVSRIANASKGELLCITYEMLLEQMEAAIRSEGEARASHMKKGIQIIQMLAGDLDFQIPLSKELFKIYIYVQGLLIKAKDNDNIEEAHKLISKIYEGFKKAAQQEEDKKPSMANAEVVYAGLTYGRNHYMTETTLQDGNRGFKA